MFFGSRKKGIRKWFNEIIRLGLSPKEVASGFAIGVFIAAFFTPGINIPLSILAAFLFRVNKVAIFLAQVIVNPLVATFVYIASLKLGITLLGYAPLKFEITDFNIYVIRYIFTTYLPAFYFGNVILASIISIASYFIVYHFMKFYYKRKEFFVIGEDKG